MGGWKDTRWRRFGGDGHRSLRSVAACYIARGCAVSSVWTADSRGLPKFEVYVECTSYWSIRMGRYCRHFMCMGFVPYPLARPAFSMGVSEVRGDFLGERFGRYYSRGLSERPGDDFLPLIFSKTKFSPYGLKRVRRRSTHSSRSFRRHNFRCHSHHGFRETRA